MSEVKLFINYEKLSSYVANIVEKQLKEKPNSTFILPTGTTPIGLYKELVKRKLDWSEATTYNLDEYIDNIDPEQSYLHFMMVNLFEHININSDNVHFPKREHDTEYGFNVDLCLLGIGGNGHIAFNEPGSSFESETRIVDLTEETIKDNSRLFDNIEDVPTQAITMGMKPIMSSKRIVMMANGKHKQRILDKAMFGRLSEELPASILQLHDNMEAVYCD